MEEKKMCCTCKYMHVSYGDEPCKSCSCCHSEDRPNWQPKNFGFKTGDIVVEKNDPMRSIKNIYIYLYDGWALRIPNYVVARSECDYNFSTYMYSLVTEDFAELIVHPKHASSEDIIGHDHRARVFYIPETLNQWFGQLIEQNTYIPRKKIDDIFVLPRRSTTNPKVTCNYKVKIKESAMSNLIKKVIFSDPATIVFWEDGTKTVVKTQDGEVYDKEKGLAMAVCKKIFGNERDYYNVFKRWMRKGEEI